VNPVTPSARRTAFYRVQYFDIPGGFIQGDWKDYNPHDLTAAEAIELRTEAERRHGGKYEFRTITAEPLKHTALVHAVCTVAKNVGVKLPIPCHLNKPALMLAGSFVARASNHGNRLPAPAGRLERDRKGRLIVHLGGAR